MRFLFIDKSYGRGGGLGRDRGVRLNLGVGVALGVPVGVAAGVPLGVAVAVGVGVAVGVAVGLDVAAQYLPPVFRLRLPSDPPQTIIWLPVHTAV